MPLIRQKRALKAHIKAYLSPFCAEYGWLEVEDIKNLTQRLAGEEEEESSSLALPPLPLEEKEVDVRVHRGVIKWLKEQHASDDVLQKVVALSPEPKEDPAGAPCSSFPASKGVAPSTVTGTAADSIAGSSTTPTSAGLTFSALRQRLKETREKLEKNQPKKEENHNPRSTEEAETAVKEKGVQQASGSTSSGPGHPHDGQAENAEVPSTAQTSNKNEKGSNEIFSVTGSGMNNPRMVLKGTSEKSSDHLSTPPLDPLSVEEKAEEKEKKSSITALISGSAASEKDRRNDAESLTSDEKERHRRSVSFMVTELAPLSAHEEDSMSKKKKKLEDVKEDGVEHTARGDGEERKKKSKESSPQLSSSHSPVQQSSPSRRLESQSGFKVVPLNDDELFDDIPVPPSSSLSGHHLHPHHSHHYYDYPPPPPPPPVPPYYPAPQSSPQHHLMMSSQHPFSSTRPTLLNSPPPSAGVSYFSPSNYSADSASDYTAGGYPSHPPYHSAPYDEEGGTIVASDKRRGGFAGGNLTSYPPSYYPENSHSGGGATAAFW